MNAKVKSHGWRDLGEIPLPTGSAKAFEKGPSRVLISHEPRHGDGKLYWHLSISNPTRYPGWDEIKDARYNLLPLGVTFVMVLPPPNEYVNIHNNCFHLWEMPDGLNW